MGLPEQILSEQYAKLTSEQREQARALMEMGPYVNDPSDPNVKLLHPVLQDSIRKLSMGYGIKHPFVNMLGIPVGQANGILKYKITMAKRMLRNDHWIPLLLLVVERPWRVEFLLRRVRRGRWSGVELNDLIESVWTDAEFPTMNFGQDVCLELFRHAEHPVIASPDEEEGETVSADQIRWNMVPDEFDVYRGVGKGGSPRGISWTLSPVQAQWFAKRYAQNAGRVFRLRVSKDQALGYFNCRSEDEVVLDTAGLKPERLTKGQLAEACEEWSNSQFAAEA